MVIKTVMWLLWLLIGLVNLIRGDISRVSYACVWVVLLVDMLCDMME